jgi:hypothetical protein
MNARNKTKPVSFKLSQRGRGALNRITRAKGWTKTLALETAIANLETSIQKLRRAA